MKQGSQRACPSSANGIAGSESGSLCPLRKLHVSSGREQRIGLLCASETCSGTLLLQTLSHEGNLAGLLVILLRARLDWAAQASILFLPSLLLVMSFPKLPALMHTLLLSQEKYK